jgi:hypothetical protein
MGHLLTFEPAPADYPNRLVDPRPAQPSLPAARWLPLLLVLLCLVPRAAMALRIPGICPDGVLYVNIAQNLEAGHLREALQAMALNIYPMILMVLHRLGLPWELAGALWGVAVSSLVVLPLWGWVRRQFDDRVALVACLLYAVHPKFIEWSPEVMRDQTFWLLFMLAIYWLWRAVTEVRYGWFIAAGGAITLASLTRVEGLFLLVPLTLWTAWRWLALGNVSPRPSGEGPGVRACQGASKDTSLFLADSPHPNPLPKGEGTICDSLPKGEGAGRRKLLLGAILCVAVFPVALMLANLFWLGGHSGWAAIRLDVLARAQAWLRSLVSHAADISTDDTLDRPMTVGRMIWVFIPTLARGLGPVFALLMFGGIVGWRRLWSRRDHQALFCTALVIMGGIWVQLWFDKAICPRYALPIVLMGSPFAALGFLWLAAGLARMVARRKITAVAWTALALIAAICLGDAMTGNSKYFATRRTAMELGRWLGRQCPAPPKMVGPLGLTAIISHYAHDGPHVMLGSDASDTIILNAVSHFDADVVLLRPWKQLTAERCESLMRQMRQDGLRPVQPAVPECPYCRLHVLVRTGRLDLVEEPTKRK